ncbi:MGT family glycosyltransferase [Colletotrichum tofieldiae]|nr:MGT family glycosyltransferase [Colletotrichum tofieldiae]
MHLSTPDGSAAAAANGKRLKFLLHCFSATGHVLPMQAVARELVERGHEVVWTTIAPQESRVVASGAKFFPAEEVVKVDANLDGANPKDMNETAEVMFSGRVTAQVADIRRVLKTFEPDFVLNDALPQGVAALYELGEIPRPFLHIQASCPSLEFQKGPEPILPQVQYVGPLVTRLAGANLGVPTWWEDVVNATSVIGITQGTFAMNPTSLIIPAIQALQGDKRHLLVVPSKCAEEIRGNITVEDNVCIAEWVPYDMLLPRCRLLVTNGGYGSVTQALSHGVPLVCAGTSEDKKDTAARVTWVGAGIDLKTDTPSVDQVRDAVHRVLNEDSYRENATRIGKELNAQGGAKKACDLLEKAAIELGAEMTSP